MRQPEIEKGAAGHDASDSPFHKAVSQAHYRHDSRSASDQVVYRQDSKDRRPELWEEAYEARVSLMASEAAETELENEHLRTLLSLTEAELGLRRKLCRCRRWTK